MRNGPGFLQHCKANNDDQIHFINSHGNRVKGTFMECKTHAKDRRNCQCDHLLEASELHRAINPTTLTDTDRKHLCEHFSHSVAEGLRQHLNGPGNLAPVTAKPNRVKHNFLHGKNVRETLTKTDLAEVGDHMKTHKDSRAKTGKALDEILNKVDASTLPAGVKEAWTKVAGSKGKTTVVHDLQKANTQRHDAAWKQHR